MLDVYLYLFSTHWYLSAEAFLSYVALSKKEAKADGHYISFG